MENIIGLHIEGEVSKRSDGLMLIPQSYLELSFVLCMIDDNTSFHFIA